MTDFLTRLAGLTLGGGAAIVLMLLLTRLTRGRYGARWRCWIWLLLALRLAAPVPLLPERTAQAAPIQLTAPRDPVVYRYTPSPAAGEAQGPGTAVTAPQPARPAATPAAPAASAPVENGGTQAERQPAARSLTLGQVLFILWLAGGVGVLGWNGLSHLRFRRWLARWGRPVQSPELLRAYNALGDQLGLSRRPRLTVCPGLGAPMLAGLLEPALLLPEGRVSGELLHYALLHELTHYRRRDIWLKALLLWVCAIHWFNPLVWLMARAAERDTELACDEGALRHLTDGQRAAYGRAILAAAAAGKELSQP